MARRCGRWFPEVVLAGLMLSLGACQAAPEQRGGSDGGDLAGSACRQTSDCAAGLSCSLGADGGGVCVSGPQPCADARPACGQSCCAADAVCVAGVCTPTTQCPAARQCGPACCGDGSECVLGRCEATCATGLRCGAAQACCAAGETCFEGRCAVDCGTRPRCGDDGDVCCAAGQVCESATCRIDCGAQARCGAAQDQCCAAGQVCLHAACVTPGSPCAHNGDCTAGQSCDPVLGRCLPRDPGRTCQYVPPTGVFQPVMKCKWSGSTVQPARDDVVATPAVANLTDDNGDGVVDRRDIPDIAFLSYDYENGGCCNQAATLRVVSGRCQADGTVLEHFSVSTPVLDNSAGIAIGDIDGDGSPDIVTMKKGGGTVAFERDGTLKWESAEPSGANFLTAVQPALADLDGDGKAEVIVGRVALRGANGTVLWKGTAGLGINSFLGPISVVADVDLDGKPEVIAGNTIYDHEGNVQCSYTFGAEGTGCGTTRACDGFNAIGNFDADDEAEIVIVREGNVYVIEHDCTLKRRYPIPVDDCSLNEGGPPTVADFDGDGRPEIGVAGADFYVVFDLDCEGTPLPAECASRGVLWKVANFDCSSRATGSSVFDFDGDGVAEVVYNDEQNFRIFRGTDGQVLFSQRNTSHTRLEYPIIVDVDNDGNAEIVFVENSYNGNDRGLEIWGDSLDNWVNTRRIWNQHSYHVTNVDEDGKIPMSEPPNWLVPGLNNFRQNVQGEGIFDAPDLVAEGVSASRRACPPTLELRALVSNRGSLGVAAGVKVAFYLVEGASQALAGVALTTRDLLPGASETVTFAWVVPPTRTREALSFVAVADDDGTGGGAHNECHEDNNSAGPSDPVVCEIQ